MEQVRPLAPQAANSRPVTHSPLPVQQPKHDVGPHLSAVEHPVTTSINKQARGKIRMVRT